MCLYIGKRSKAHIAKKPIVAYKILVRNPFNFDNFKSPFFNNDVYLDSLQYVNQSFQIVESPGCLSKLQINGGGFHVFKKLKDAIYIAQQLVSQNDIVVVKVIIPQYTIYFKGENSDQNNTKGYCTQRIYYTNNILAAFKS